MSYQKTFNYQFSLSNDHENYFNCFKNIFSLTLKQIPVAVTYAIWSGVGLVLINIFAAIKYGQMPNSITTLGMAFIILGVVLVNFNTGVD